MTLSVKTGSGEGSNRPALKIMNRLTGQLSGGCLVLALLAQLVVPSGGYVSNRTRGSLGPLDLERERLEVRLEKERLEARLENTIEREVLINLDRRQEPQECPPCVCLLEDMVMRTTPPPTVPTTTTSTTTTATSSTAASSTSAYQRPETTIMSNEIDDTLPDDFLKPPGGWPDNGQRPQSGNDVRPPQGEKPIDHGFDPRPPPPTTSSQEGAAGTDNSCRGQSRQDIPDDVCLTESCILAAGTILSSLDRTVDPCEDFYEYACGGWVQRSVATNTDRFQALSKRNQNIIQSILEGNPSANMSAAEKKTRDFYRSCTQDGDGVTSDDLTNLQAVINYVGGWNVSGDNTSTSDIDINQRIYRLQNQLGVSVLFTWGVVAENNSHHIAVVPGGWVDEYLEDGDSYLKLMTGISWMLQEAAKCPPAEYIYDMDMDLGINDTLNQTVEIDYEYSYDMNTEDVPNLLSMLQMVFWPSPDYYYQFSPDLNLSDSVDDMTGDGGTHDWQRGSFDAFQQYKRLEEDTDEASVETEDSTERSAESSLPPVPEARREPEKNIHKTNRDECISRLHRALEGETLANIVNQKNDLEKLMAGILSIEQKLSNLTTSSPGSSEVALTPLTPQEIKDNFPFLDWTEFFGRGFQIVDYELPADTKILVDYDYLKGVQKLMETVERVDLVNYLVWRLIMTFYPSKSSDEEKRRETCLQQTEDVFGPVITALYVKHRTIETSMQVVKEVGSMVDTMKDTFRDSLDHVDWMTNKSRDAAKEKLDNMMDLIGYPEQVLNGTWLNQRYEDVEVTEDYLMNIISFQSYERKEGMKLFKRKYERGWVESSHGGSIVTVNAFYSPTSNIMIVPIGMLQDPLYWSHPKSLSFGAFGIVVAHEITHAFDDEGINYDSEGMLSQLYDNQTIHAFHREADCLRKQYSTYSMKDTLLDGNLTLTENLADHGGLKLAYSAYHKWRSTHSDFRLPAVPFTDEQLFFLGYAMPWCSTHTDTQAISQLAKDEHSPDRFRVWGPLSNSPEFAKAWNCPRDSKMNPPDKCSVW